ncbi:MAG: hypothetical protein CVU00_12610 [Bacteroidetes bacterium HGW-Bacteroidetes-17]|nr:MAG: hypothetical protein CVU00_12610 [Bacteroidetes bacterium HGW-Bacteroidetes-17]
MGHSGYSQFKVSKNKVLVVNCGKTYALVKNFFTEWTQSYTFVSHEKVDTFSTINFLWEYHKTKNKNIFDRNQNSVNFANMRQ